MKVITNYTLGPLPWSEEALRQAYFRSFTHAQKAIQEHLGFAAHRDLHGLQLSLDIFLNSLAELFQSIDAFHMDAQSARFWTRSTQSQFKSRELAVRRGVFTVATSALALVDHSRKVRKSIAITQEEYQRQLKEIFDEHEHRFIQSLRVCVSHIRMIEADWQRIYSTSGKQTRFLLRREVLLQWDDWDKQARIFIDRHHDGIDIEKLFNTYRARVEKFHLWFHNAIIRVSEPQLSEYREYERMLKRFGTRAWWNLLLEQVVMGRLDPYTYLDRYLTQTELEEVLALPRQSQVQIDRIIEILDEYGACDEELRKKAYRAFGVEIPHSET
jgi:hypothetical protein